MHTESHVYTIGLGLPEQDMPHSQHLVLEHFGNGIENYEVTDPGSNMSDSQSDSESVSVEICDSDLEGEKHETLSVDQAEWAATFQIPHKELQQLLLVLNVFFPELPRDPRTL